MTKIKWNVIRQNYWKNRVLKVKVLKKGFLNMNKIEIINYHFKQFYHPKAYLQITNNLMCAKILLWAIYNQCKNKKITRMGKFHQIFVDQVLAALAITSMETII